MLPLAALLAQEGLGGERAMTWRVAIGRAYGAWLCPLGLTAWLLVQPALAQTGVGLRIVPADAAPSPPEDSSPSSPVPRLLAAGGSPLRIVGKSKVGLTANEPGGLSPRS